MARSALQESGATVIVVASWTAPLSAIRIVKGGDLLLVCRLQPRLSKARISRHHRDECPAVGRHFQGGHPQLCCVDCESRRDSPTGYASHFEKLTASKSPPHGQRGRLSCGLPSFSPSLLEHLHAIDTSRLLENHGCGRIGSRRLSNRTRSRTIPINFVLPRLALEAAEVPTAVAAALPAMRQSMPT